MDEDKLLSISDVCRVLGIGKSTWYSWRQRGHGPPTVPIGPPDALKKRLTRVRRPTCSTGSAINTMRITGRDMLDKYKETSRGGLAVNVIEC